METGWILPDLSNESTRGFWEGCAAGELRIQACSDCGAKRMPPRPMCPVCRSTDSGWQVMSGEGRIWSYVVAHPPLLPAYEKQAPYPVVTVELVEDPSIRLVGALVGWARLLGARAAVSDVRRALTACTPRSVKWNGTRLATCSNTAAEMKTSPGVAKDSMRAARLTPSP